MLPEGANSGSRMQGDAARQRRSSAASGKLRPKFSTPAGVAELAPQLLRTQIPRAMDFSQKSRRNDSTIARRFNAGSPPINILSPKGTTDVWSRPTYLIYSKQETRGSREQAGVFD